MIRTSLVNQVSVTAISAASTFIAGDAVKTTSTTRAIAIQRQVAVFFENEGEFADFDIFTDKIPQPLLSKSITMQVVQESPFIKVNSIAIIGIAEASTVQIGSTRFISLDARIKHFRQFVH